MRNSKTPSRSLWELRSDPVRFAEQLLDFHPYPYQTKLLRDPNRRILVRMCRQAGKTTTIAVRAIWYAITHPETTTLIVAPSLRQSMIMMDNLQTLLQQLPPLIYKYAVKKSQRTQLQFQNNSRIIALPCSQNLLRGYRAHQVLADEAAFFQEDKTIFYSVLYPMLATTNGTLIVSSTPWSPDSVFYKMNQDPTFSKHVIPWPEVTKTGLITKAFIEEQRQALPPEVFTMEYEAEFAEDQDAYFPQELIKSCINPKAEYWNELDLLPV